MNTMNLFLLYIVAGALPVEADSLAGDTALAAWDAPARRNWAVPHPGACAMDVSAGTAELLQVGIGLWSSVRVCKETSDGGKESKTICIADVAGVVSSLTNVGQYILGGIDSCMGRQTISNSVCAQKSMVLAGAISQAAGTATSLSNGCVASKFKEDSQIFNGASCIVDIRSAMQGFMTAILEMMHLKRQCSISPQRCTEFSAHLIASLAGLARYALSAAGDCGGKVPPGSQCGAEISTLIQSMTTIVAASTGVDEACDPKYAPPTPPPFDTQNVALHTDGSLTMPNPFHKMTPDQTATIAALRANLTTAQRLFGVKQEPLWDDHDPKQTSLSINATLIGLLPFAAIVAFFTGRRTGQSNEYQRPESTFKAVNADDSA